MDVDTAHFSSYRGFLCTCHRTTHQHGSGHLRIVAMRIRANLSIYVPPHRDPTQHESFNTRSGTPRSSSRLTEQCTSPQGATHFVAGNVRSSAPQNSSVDNHVPASRPIIEAILSFLWRAYANPHTPKRLMPNRSICGTCRVYTYKYLI